ncbi:MAG: periplasmic heavy metal sensor [Hyphomicrobiaceae bacterium]
MTDAPTQSGAPIRRAPRWLWIGFFLSLAVNLLVIGAAAGAIWHFKRSEKLRQVGAPRHFGAFLWRLPSDRRQAFRKMIRKRRPELRPFREDVRAARREAAGVLRQEPFDREAFLAANKKFAEARARLRSAEAEFFPRIVEMMTAEERREFLDWREHHRRRWRRRDASDNE